MSKLVDAALIVGALVMSLLLYKPVWDLKYSMAALLAASVFFFLAEIAGLYRPWRGETARRQFFQILFIWAGTFFVLLLLAYAFKTSEAYSRVSIGAWLLITPLLLSGWRVLARALYGRLLISDSQKRNAVVWGAGELGDQLTQTIEQSPWLGLRLTEYIRADEGEWPARASQELGPVRGLSKLEKLELKAKRGDFDILYIALPTTARAQITELLDRLADTTVTVYMVPDYFTTSLFNGKWSYLEGIPLISVYDTPFWGVDGWVKRAEDVILSSLILLVVAIPMLLIAIAVKLSSPGPVFFKQRRYGMDGREISVWKFRSMSICEDGPTAATLIPPSSRHGLLGSIGQEGPSCGQPEASRESPGLWRVLSLVAVAGRPVKGPVRSVARASCSDGAYDVCLAVLTVAAHGGEPPLSSQSDREQRPVIRLLSPQGNYEPDHGFVIGLR